MGITNRRALPWLGGAAIVLTVVLLPGIYARMMPPPEAAFPYADRQAPPAALEMSRALAGEGTGAAPPATDRGLRSGWALLATLVPIAAGLALGLALHRLRPPATASRTVTDDHRVAIPPELRREIDEAARYIRRLEASLARREARIRWLKNALKTLRRGSAPVAVGNRDEETRLWVELQTRADVIASLEDLIKENVDRWSDFEIDLLDRDARIGELRADAEAAAAVIRSLEDELERAGRDPSAARRRAGLFARQADDARTGTD